MKKKFKTIGALMVAMAMIMGVAFSSGSTVNAESYDELDLSNPDYYMSVVNVMGDTVYYGDVVIGTAYDVYGGGFIDPATLPLTKQAYTTIPGVESYKNYPSYQQASSEIEGMNLSYGEIFCRTYGKYFLTPYTKTANSYGFYSRFDKEHPDAKHFDDERFTYTNTLGGLSYKPMTQTLYERYSTLYEYNHREWSDRIR